MGLQPFQHVAALTPEAARLWQPIAENRARILGEASLSNKMLTASHDGGEHLVGHPSSLAELSDRARRSADGVAESGIKGHV